MNSVNNAIFANFSALNNLQPDQTSFSIEQCENIFKMSVQSLLGVFQFI